MALPLPSSLHTQTTPDVLRHLERLTQPFVRDGEPLSYINIYAKPDSEAPDAALTFVLANQSGFEGIACVDDAARAVLLACQAYERRPSATALRLIRAWCDFVVYMQEPDGRFVNFIADGSGAKNFNGQTSHQGGAWWTARAMHALAVAYRVTGDNRYLRSFAQGRFVRTRDLKIQGVEALTLLDSYACGKSSGVGSRIATLCDRIVASGPGYFRDWHGQDDVALWGYHQFQAVARAGRLLGRLDYVAACEETVRNLIEPVIAGGFYHTFPRQPDRQCAYCISPLVLGLEDLNRLTHKRHYRDLALECASWLYGHNPAGRPLYDPETGRCADGITEGIVSGYCGAESTIEAGFIELARQRLLATPQERRRDGGRPHGAGQV